jgi:hypothetical protein
MAHSELRMWMRMGLLALVAFLMSREMARVHLLFLRSEKDLGQEEKEELRRFMEITVLVVLGKV